MRAPSKRFLAAEIGTGPEMRLRKEALERIKVQYQKHFYVIGDSGGIVERNGVSEKVWNALWPWAAKHGVRITHYVSILGGLHKVRWRK